MARRRNPVVSRLFASLSIAFLRVTARLPLPLCRAVGRAIGYAIYWMAPRVRTVARVNIEEAFGDELSASEKKRILLEACQNLAIVATEFSHGPKLIAPGGKDLFDVKGVEHMDRSRGALMVGAHLGNWEWMSGAAVAAGFEAAIIVREFDEPRLDRAITAVRDGMGVVVTKKDSAGGEVIRQIREGKIVGILIDQSPRENGVPVTFFGRPCWATVAPAMAAVRAKAPIHPVAMTRDSAGRYTLEFLPAIEVKRSGDLRKDLVDAIQKCQDAIEGLVRKNPGQWLWMHRRWKERPRLQEQWDERMGRGK